MRTVLAVLTLIFASSLWGQEGASELVKLRGIILSHDGKPIYAAFVYLDPPEGDLPQHTGDWAVDRPDGFSRMNGEFFVAKPPGNYRLTVWIGKQRVFVQPIELKGGEQKIEIRLPPLPSIHGKLVDDDGNPVPQKMVMLENSATQESRVAIADSKGEFTLVLPPAGEATIKVFEPSGNQLLTEQKIVVAGDKDEELTLRLPKLPRLTVRILKSDGKPLANAPVTVAVGFTSGEFTTDENGRITLPPLSQTGRQKVLLKAKGEGWAIVAVEPRNLPLQPFEVRLQPFASISGKLVTLDGKPIVGAEVVANPLAPTNPFPTFELRQIARTDGRGLFKIGELWAGNYRLEVQSKRFRIPSFGMSVWVAPGQTKNLTLVAAPAEEAPKVSAKIVGQVLDAQGNPVAEATVQLNKQLPNPWGFTEVRPSEPVKTDEQGRFELANVPSGWNVLSARTKDGKDAVHWVYVPHAESDKAQQISVTLQLPKEFGSIKGRVFKDGGKTPAVGVGVMAIESHYYLVNMWEVEQAVMNLQINENQTICVGGG